MKGYNKSILILTFILFISLLFPINTKAESDINYTFQNDHLFDSESTPLSYNWGSPPIAKLNNVRNSSSMTNQTYIAFYTFTNDTDYGNPTDWSIDETGGSVNVFPVIESHDKVVELNDTSAVASTTFGQDFGNGVQASGTIEYWIRSDDTTDNVVINVQNDATQNAILFYIRDDLFRHYDGAVFQTIPGSPIPINNQWYHIRIDFECGGGGYQGLGADEYFIYISGTKYGAFDLRNPSVNLENIYFQTLSGHIFKVYIDAIDYSWETNYNYWRNTIPQIDINTDIKEVDRYEFAYSSFQTIYPIGSDEYNSWTEIDDVRDDVNIASNPIYSSDRVINIDFDGLSAQLYGIYKNFSHHANFFNVTWAINYTTLEASGNFFTKIYSYDKTLIAEFDIENIFLNSLQPTVTHYIGITENEYYQFNLYINYYDNIGILIFYIDGIYESTSYITLITTGKEGLGKIEFIVDGSSLFLLNVNIDYVGVFIEEQSICEWFGYLRTGAILTHPESWYLTNHDLFSFSFDNTTLASFWVSRDSYIPFISSITRLTPLDTYDSYDRVSVYGKSAPIPQPNIWCQFYGLIQADLNFTIDGSKLTEGSNEYFLEMTYSGIDLTDNYFYVGSGNRLEFIHTSDDTNLEYIQANFNINDKSSNDRGISFKGYRLDKAYGYLALVFDPTGSNVFDIPIFEKTTRSLITPNRTIANITILITDNNQDSVLGITTGFISNISLLATTGIGISIITAGLLSMMIPLILILIPTLTLSVKLGKKLIIPLFLVFSLVITIASIIPFWVFFIIIFGGGLFIMLNKRYDD